MSRFSQYLDKDYLPGEVYESTLGELRFEPVAELLTRDQTRS